MSEPKIKRPPPASGGRDENDWLIDEVRRLDDKFIERNGEFGFDVHIVRWRSRETTNRELMRQCRDDGYGKLGVS